MLLYIFDNNKAHDLYYLTLSSSGNICCIAPTSSAKPAVEILRKEKYKHSKKKRQLEIILKKLL